jgi:hypothetical protein
MHACAFSGVVAAIGEQHDGADCKKKLRNHELEMFLARELIK